MVTECGIWGALLSSQNSALRADSLWVFFFFFWCVVVDFGSYILMNTVTLLVTLGTKWKKDYKRQLGERIARPKKRKASCLFLEHHNVTAFKYDCLCKIQMVKTEDHKFCVFVFLFLFIC